MKLALEQRAKFAQLLREVASGAVSASDAIAITKAWSDAPWDEPEFADAFHFLGHFESDEDIRQKDPAYARHQIETLLRLAERLAC